ncbi:retrotransposon protein, putative, ty1-copia subclass, partial [Tanacetum coccineum]
DYALESAACILNMVPTKKVDKTPYEVWHGQAPKLPYLKVWGCEALVKRDTLTKPKKLEPRSIKCIFVGYPKETIGYSFYYLPENKVFIVRNTEFLENSLITQEASGSLKDLESIQEEDTHPSLDTSLDHEEDDQEINQPQSDINPIRRSTRTRRALDRMCLYIDAEEFELGDLDAIHEIQRSLELVDLPPDEKTVGHKWLFKKKTDMDRAIHTYKARLDSSLKWMSKLPSSMDISMKRFSQNRDEPCVYVKASGSYVTFLILYVDDILIMGNNIPMLQDVKSYFGRCFAMKDLGEAAYILGIKIYRDRSKRLIGLCQSAYIEKIIKRFYMENSIRGTIPMQENMKFSKSQGASTPVEIQRMQNIPYASAVGSTMYVVRCTRRDVAFTQNITSRFQQNPGEVYWTAVKNILKYLGNTKDMFLVYGGDMKRELRVSCYTDAGYLTDADDMKSQTGYMLNISLPFASKETVWIGKFISGLGVVPTIEKPINMYCDNTGAIAVVKDHEVTKGARHFHAKVYYLRETIEMGDVKIEKVDTDDNLADPFTKALAFPKHYELTKKIGMIPASSLM